MLWTNSTFGMRLPLWALAALTAVAHAAVGGHAFGPPQSAPAPQIPAVPATQPAPTPPASRFVVVLDAAHGGDDPGGKLNGQAEKDFTLALSVRLRSLLARAAFRLSPRANPI